MLLSVKVCDRCEWLLLLLLPLLLLSAKRLPALLAVWLWRAHVMCSRFVYMYRM
jgi:hypothetical protein